MPAALSSSVADALGDLPRFYFEHEADRDKEWDRMLKDGFMHIKAYEPPALKD